MYKILLVDDEQMALTGIKFIIDWNEIECEIAGTASNGQDALDKIARLQPDIVICDINLPVYSGIEVLEQIGKSFPQIVFIMLTNHQEFDLAQQSLRYKAVDYLLKTNLKPEEVMVSIQKAKDEVNSRKKLSKVGFVEDYLMNNQSHMLAENLRLIFTDTPHPGTESAYQICEDYHLFDHYFIIRLMLKFSDLQHFAGFSAREKNKIFLVLEDIILKISRTFFADSLLVKSDVNFFHLYVWKETRIDKDKIRHFQERLTTSTQNLTNIEISTLISSMLTGKEMLEKGREQLIYLENCYFRAPSPLLFFKDGDMDLSATNFNVNVILQELTPAILGNDEEAVNAVFDNLIDLFSASSQKKQNAVSCCIQLYSYLQNMLSSRLQGSQYQAYFEDADVQLTSIACVSEFPEILAWLEQLRQKLIRYIQRSSQTENTDYLTLAREYIQSHIEDKITLGSVAEFINITPNYLSTLFKQKYHQNFVDYVNAAKMQEACKLIRQNKYLMYEIAYTLGYENAYYFSKIFKKHIGQTPKEYQLTHAKGLEYHDTEI